MWKYKGKNFKTPGDDYGFIYKITDDKGRFYIGKKAFSHRIKRKLSKRARKSTGKRIKIENKDSGWKDYWGSCKPLLEYIESKGNTQGFTREILMLCEDRINLSYWEIHFQIQLNVLFEEKSWNSNVGGKYFKGKIHGK